MKFILVLIFEFFVVENCCSIQSHPCDYFHFNYQNNLLIQEELLNLKYYPELNIIIITINLYFCRNLLHFMHNMDLCIYLIDLSSYSHPSFCLKAHHKYFQDFHHYSLVLLFKGHNFLEAVDKSYYPIHKNYSFQKLISVSNYLHQFNLLNFLHDNICLINIFIIVQI